MLGSSSQYDVTAAGGNLEDLNDTVTLSFAADQDIADTFGNALATTAPTETNENTWVVDNTAPTVASITRQTPSSSPTGADSLTWRVTFSEAVANVDAADFKVTGTNARLTTAAVPGSSSQYDVTAAGSNLEDLNDTVMLSFAADQDIADTAGIALAGIEPTETNENTWVVDNTAPTVASIARQTPSSSPTNADSLTWRVTFSEDLANVDAADFKVTGTNASTDHRRRAGVVLPV